MPDLAIRVENLSKLYRIGAMQAPYKTLRDTLTDAVAAPFRHLADRRRRTADGGQQTAVGGQRSAVSGRDNTIWALKDVSFEVQRGEVIGIFAEVEKFIDTPVKHFSSGMYVRLALAVAAHLEPEILLVDEVLAVGDVAFQKKCLGKMGGC